MVENETLSVEWQTLLKEAEKAAAEDLYIRYNTSGLGLPTPSLENIPLYRKLGQIPNLAFVAYEALAELWPYSFAATAEVAAQEEIIEHQEYQIRHSQDLLVEVEPLLSLLEDIFRAPETPEYQCALQLIHECCTPDGIALFLRLYDGDMTPRPEKMFRILSLADELLPLLDAICHTMTHGEGLVQSAAIYLAETIAVARPEQLAKLEELLHELITSEKDEDVVISALVCIQGEIFNTSRTVELLIKQLPTASPYIQNEIAEAFMCFDTPQLHKQLQKHYPLWPPEAQTVVSNAFPKVTFPVEHALDDLLAQSQHESPLIRKQAVEGLARLGTDEALQRILELFNDTEFTVQLEARSTLKYRVPKEKTEHLREQFTEFAKQSTDGYLQKWAIEELTRWPGQDTEGLLLGVLQSAVKNDVKEVAVLALQKLNATHLSSHIAELLTHNINSLRSKAAKVLASFEQHDLVAAHYANPSSHFLLVYEDFWLLKERLYPEALPLLRELRSESYTQSRIPELLASYEIPDLAEQLTQFLQLERCVDGPTTNLCLFSLMILQANSLQSPALYQHIRELIAPIQEEAETTKHHRDLLYHAIPLLLEAKDEFSLSTLTQALFHLLMMNCSHSSVHLQYSVWSINMLVEAICEKKHQTELPYATCKELEYKLQHYRRQFLQEIQKQNSVLSYQKPYLSDINTSIQKLLYTIAPEHIDAFVDTLEEALFD